MNTDTDGAFGVMIVILCLLLVAFGLAVVFS